MRVMEDQPTQLEAPERVVELDWWQGSNGRWFEGGNPEDEWGHAAPKVTGRRVVAALIDLIPLTVLFFGLAQRYEGIQTGDRSFEVSLQGFGALLFLLLVPMYFVISEGTTSTSPGKRIMSLQVSHTDGTIMTWRSAALRNLLRLVDAFPFLYLVGMVTIWSTKTRQRIGDLAASTVVHPILGKDTEPAWRRRATPILLATTLVPLLAGVALLRAGPPEQTLGGIPLDPTVNDFIEETVQAVFVPIDHEAFAAYAVPELEREQSQAMLAALADVTGPLSGAYSIENTHTRDHILPNGATYEAVEYEIRARFDAGWAFLRIRVINRDGQLQIVGWHVRDR